MSILSERRTSPTDKRVGLLVNGERRKQPEFHRRYAKNDEDEKWELIGGIVYIASPLKLIHKPGDGVRFVPVETEGWQELTAVKNRTVSAGLCISLASRGT